MCPSYLLILYVCYLKSECYKYSILNIINIMRQMVIVNKIHQSIDMIEIKTVLKAFCNNWLVAANVIEC
jgi:hypothetical protein